MFFDEKEIDAKKLCAGYFTYCLSYRERYFVNDDRVIEERNPYYKHCNSHHFIKKDFIGK